MNSSSHTLGFRFEKAAGPGSTSPVGGLALTKDRIVVGALASADLRLLGAGVSSIHAVIERTAAGLTVFDLASETGVRLNGKPVVTAQFQDGDLLEIAGFEIRCVQWVPEAPVAAVSAPQVLPSRPVFLSASSAAPKSLTVEANAPQVEAKAPQVEAKAPQVEAKAPQVEAKAPQVEAKAPQVEAKAPQVEAKAPQVEAKAPQVEAKAPQVEAKAPQVEAKAPQVEAKAEAVVRPPVSTEKIQPVPAAREFPSRKPSLPPVQKRDLGPLLLVDEEVVVPIFQKRSDQEKALEVVLSWRRTILDVQHYLDQPKVVIGSVADADFAIPALLDSERFVFLDRDSTGIYHLNLDRRMKGVVQRNGRLEKLEELRAGREGSVALPLKQGDFAKIQLGELTFYLSYSACPPELLKRKAVAADPIFKRSLGTSLGLTALLLISVFQMTVPKSVQTEELPERIATILYQPEKYSPLSPPEKRAPEPEKQTPPSVTKLDLKPSAPKNLPLNVAKASPAQLKQQFAGRPISQRVAKEGQGARAKGTEGARGSKDSKIAGAPQNQAQGKGSSQIEGIGNIDFLKGAGGQVQNLLAGASRKMGNGSQRPSGFGSMTTQGNGGLALSGTGKGGGGTAATTLSGLSDKGTGGGRVGTGWGAAGDGSGVVGGRVKIVGQPDGTDDGVTMGVIDQSAVEAAILAHRDEIRHCYEKEQNTQSRGGLFPTRLSGRVSVSFTIGSLGRVSQVGIASTTLKSDPIEECILKVFRIIEFPIPRGGGVVEATYPFQFRGIGNL